MDPQIGHWTKFLRSHDAAQIAAHLRRDQDLCKAGKLPTDLALQMPQATSELANSVALHLLPENASLPRSIRKMHYSGVVEGIKSFLKSTTSRALPASQETASASRHRHPKPSTEQYSNALEVLNYLLREQEVPEIHLGASIQDLSDALARHLRPEQEQAGWENRALSEDSIPARTYRSCYMCQMKIVQCHPQYSSLCRPCGRFYHAESSLSLPQSLSLDGVTALVTGGRVNLGFHTTLRLLRCGARVIVSTRYPRDAQSRFLAESDSATWRSNLKIAGADFRAAKDVFQLVRAVKEILKIWAAETDRDGTAKLDILVNNATQTLTESIEKERKAIALEKKLQLVSAPGKSLLVNEDGYETQLKGGMETNGVFVGQAPATILFAPDSLVSASRIAEEHSSLQSPSMESSWTDALPETPFEDLVSAHSVNNFVPLILTRSLLPLMGHSPSSPSTTTSRSSITVNLSTNSPPLGYVLNVVPHESLLESAHLSSSDAGLNTITETEATSAWNERRVAINSIGQECMTRAKIAKQNEKMEVGDQYLGGWAGEVSRVLWPVAMGWGSERGGEAIWGKYLEYFGSEEVTSR